MFSTNGATFDIVCYVCINTGPVDVSSSYMSHFFYPLVAVV